MWLSIPSRTFLRTFAGAPAGLAQGIRSVNEAAQPVDDKGYEVDPVDPLVTGGTECYAVNTSASWYHPEWCHSFDHHEWIHAELERGKGSVHEAYEAMDTSRQLYTKAVELLREVYETSQMTPAVHAKVTTFLRGSEWHEALRAFHEGGD